MSWYLPSLDELRRLDGMQDIEPLPSELVCVAVALPKPLGALQGTVNIMGVPSLTCRGEA